MPPIEGLQAERAQYQQTLKDLCGLGQELSLQAAVGAALPIIGRAAVSLLETPEVE